MVKKQIGDKIRDIRYKNKLKQAEFVAALNIDRAYLSQIESNKRKPGRELLIKIAREFNVSLDALISDETSHLTTTAQNNDEAMLLYAFRQMPEEEAKLHLQLMLNRVNNKT